MSKAFDLSIVLILPVSYQDDGNRLSCALGYDVMPGRTFSVPLSADGAAPATHYGCRTSGDQGFVDTVAGAEGGSLPDDLRLRPFGLNRTKVFALVGELIEDVRSVDAMIGHLDDVAAANNLKRVVEDGDD